MKTCTSKSTMRPLGANAVVCYLAAASAAVSFQSCESFSPSQKRAQSMGHHHPLKTKLLQSQQALSLNTPTLDTTAIFMSSSMEEELQQRRRRNREMEIDSNSDPLRDLLEEPPFPTAKNNGKDPADDTSNSNEPSLSLWNQFSDQFTKFKLPPIQIDDANLLLYDVFLLLNLSVSISFWVVHRMQLDFVALAFNEGCLMSILWIMAGLYHGAFLESAKDGHQKPAYYIGEDNSEKEKAEVKDKPFWELPALTRGGPSAAGLLAVNTFINTISLRLIVALVVAVMEHRPVFDDPLEQLIPYEVGFGLVLMSVWRTIHSAYSPRV